MFKTGGRQTSDLAMVHMPHDRHHRRPWLCILVAICAKHNHPYKSRYGRTWQTCSGLQVLMSPCAGSLPHQKLAS